MLVPLSAAFAATCGGKAAGLGALIRAGLPVPDGVVIPFDPRGAGADDPRGAGFDDRLGEAETDELRGWLMSAGDPVVAVRSSASNEDTALTSAAGQHDSFLGVQGIDAVVDAVRACRTSRWSPRATAYRNGAEPPSMAVVIQQHIDADISGVLFTPTDPTAPTVIESSWGLGPSVVEGRVTPDRYQVLAGAVTRTIADKPTLLDRDGSHPVPADQRRTPTLTDATALNLATLAQQAAAIFGAPQDIEWAIANTTTWLLQSRPITAHPPTPTEPTMAEPSEATLTGTPASKGTAIGPARIVRGPADFLHVRPGDILVCPHTDPAWTQLLRVAAGVITESGGILSHAAITAREQSIPAVVGVPHATTRIPTGATVDLDGSTGAVRLKNASGI
jgi:pyruvate,water dikinase